VFYRLWNHDIFASCQINQDKKGAIYRIKSNKNEEKRTPPLRDRTPPLREKITHKLEDRTESSNFSFFRREYGSNIFHQENINKKEKKNHYEQEKVERKISDDSTERKIQE
jgi:hypothetical protein